MEEGCIRQAEIKPLNYAHPTNNRDGVTVRIGERANRVRATIWTGTTMPPWRPALFLL
jgi:hypothetical protein